MRTVFFVDGYNLYYGLVSDTRYKWLNLPSLLASIIHEQDPASQVVGVHYFTAPVQPKLATRGTKSKEAQDSYIRALKAHQVEIHLGRHRLDHRKAPRFVCNKTPASREDKVDIWHLEEKETDVRIAIEMYRLAVSQQYKDEEDVQQLVLVSSDTDMAPALEAIRKDYPHLRIGIILPRGRKRTDRSDRSAGSLRKNADWMRHSISEEELDAHQFPDRVPTRKKPADKPDYW